MNPKEMANISDLDDKKLVALSDALENELERRKIPFDSKFFAILEQCETDILDVFANRVSDEEFKRAEHYSKAETAHDLEQGEAADVAGILDGQKRLVYRCARLHKLARLNAPKLILEQSLELVITAMEGIK